MSLSQVRPFFRDRLESLGLSEHDQPFEPNEIGASITDDSFHIEIGAIASLPANQLVYNFSVPVTVRLYKTGYSNLNDAYDEILGLADTVLADFLQPSVRLAGTPIKDIVPNTVQPTPLAPSNDNVIILELAFTAELQLCFN